MISRLPTAMFLLSAVCEFGHAAFDLTLTGTVALGHLLHWGAAAIIIWIEHQHLEHKAELLRTEQECQSAAERRLRALQRDEEAAKPEARPGEIRAESQPK